MSYLSPLSDYQVEDDILRSMMYQHILDAIKARSLGITEHEIKEDEMYRPDLVSYRVYGVSDLRWLVSLLSDEEDEIEALPVGLVLRMPGKAWIHETIRVFREKRDVNLIGSEVI